MNRRLIDPFLLGLQGTETAYPWWLTGGLPAQAFPHTQPAGGGDIGGGGSTSGTGGDGAPESGTGGGTTDGGTGGQPDEAAERMREHLSQADKKRAEAEKERDALAQRLKEFEDKDKSELERATARVQELEKKAAEQDSELADLRLQNAFLTVNNVTWHDPAAALLLAQREGFLDGVVGQDGKVDQAKLKTKLEQLAKQKEYLVKKDAGTPPPPPPPSGSGVGSGSRTPSNSTPEEKALKERYRLLNR
jgi:hypothetical protein